MYHKFLDPYITQEVVLCPDRRTLHLLNGIFSTFYQNDTIPQNQVTTDSYRVIERIDNATMNGTNTSTATESSAQQFQPTSTGDFVSQDSLAVERDIQCDFCDYTA